MLSVANTQINTSIMKFDIWQCAQVARMNPGILGKSPDNAPIFVILPKYLWFDAHLVHNTPPGAKLGVCRRTIYSKWSTADHNLFQIFLQESKFFFEHQIFLSLSHCRGIKRKVGAGEIGI